MLWRDVGIGNCPVLSFWPLLGKANDGTNLPRSVEMHKIGSNVGPRGSIFASKRLHCINTFNQNPCGNVSTFAVRARGEKYNGHPVSRCYAGSPMAYRGISYELANFSMDRLNFLSDGYSPKATAWMAWSLGKKWKD